MTADVDDVVVAQRFQGDHCGDDLDGRRRLSGSVGCLGKDDGPCARIHHHHASGTDLFGNVGQGVVFRVNRCGDSRALRSLAGRLRAMCGSPCAAAARAAVRLPTLALGAATLQGAGGLGCLGDLFWRGAGFLRRGLLGFGDFLAAGASRQPVSARQLFAEAFFFAATEDAVVFFDFFIVSGDVADCCAPDAAMAGCRKKVMQNEQTGKGKVSAHVESWQQVDGKCRNY